MKDTNEIKALLHLLDDPDKEIFETVANKILNYGPEIIPNLEQLWESTPDNQVQIRIESLIHKVSFIQTQKGFNDWFKSQKQNLLEGAIHLSRFQFADIDEATLRKTIKSIYQSCWLELNNFLTPLEQINILNSIFYSMYKFFGHELEENKPNHYFISEVLETRIGNSYSLGLIYQYICEMLDIPVFTIQLPQQYLLAYFNIEHNFFDTEKTAHTKIQFYIDPSNGSIFTQNDVDVYIKKFNITLTPKSLLPLSNEEIITTHFNALIQVYEQHKDFDKINELNHLLALKK
jgi:regulator of sirC expression with transglutaminase-like and TPR domain